MSRTAFVIVIANVFVIVFVVAFVIACETPRSAEEHRALAAQEAAEASAHMARYDESARAAALTPAPLGSGLEVQEYNPTHFEKVAADAHARAAERHRDKARALEQSEAAACADTPRPTRTACPLLLPISVEDIARGVRVTFVDEATATRAAHTIQCQQAFAEAEGFKDLPSCTLYARKLVLAQRGSTLELTAGDASGVERLRAGVRGHGRQ